MISFSLQMQKLKCQNTKKDTELKLLPKGHIGKLKAFKAYCHFRETNGDPITDDGWEKITKGDFDTFRISTNYLSYQLNGPPTGTSSRSTLDPVREFKRGIKRDVTVYSVLKDDAVWDNWNRSTVAHARAQDVEDVLDPTYKPITPEDKGVFKEKQKYMFAVFESVLKTDKGKAIVCK